MRKEAPDADRSAGWSSKGESSIPYKIEGYPMPRLGDASGAAKTSFGFAAAAALVVLSLM
jgi:hypothetical protein